MRLHKLTLSAFLAFPGVEHVDFDALGESGLFLLQGRTGAGKTSLLDAVCFAFYGTVPGARADGARLRSDHADAETATEVTLEATVRGQRIVVTRAPEQERPKLRGTGLTTESHRVTIIAVEDDGTQRILATRPDEAREVLNDLLGMTREQFCQVVLLPQGGFAKFLHARSDERAALLRELFDVGRFANVETWLADRRRVAKRDAEEATAKVRDLIARAAEVSGTEPPEDWADGPSATVDGWLDEQLVVSEASVTTAENAAAETQERRVAADAHLVAGQQLAREREAHAAAVDALATWEFRREQRDAAARDVEAARRAAPCEPLIVELEARAASAQQTTAAAEQALASVGVGDDADLRALARGRREQAGTVVAVADRERRLEAAATEADELTRAAATQTAEAERLDGEIARVEQETVAARERIATASRAAAQLGGLDQGADGAALQAAQGVERDAAAQKLGTLEAEHLIARERAVAAREQHAALLGRRLDGIAAELAAHLVDGAPCGVCGSVEHPEPAVAPAGGIVTAELVAEAETAATALSATRDAVAQRITDARGRLAAARAVAGDAPISDLRETADRAEQARTLARAEASDLATAEDALRTLEHVSRDLRTQRDATRAAATTAAAKAHERALAAETDRSLVEEARAGEPSIAARVQRLTAAADAFEAAAEAVDAMRRATAEHTTAVGRAAEAARTAGFPDLAFMRAALLSAADCADRDNRVRLWDEGVVERRTAVQRPELVVAAAAAPPAVDELRRLAAVATQNAESAQRTLAVTRQCARSLQDLRGRLTEALGEAEPLRAALAVITEVADLANGTSASNRQRMRLTAYVLAARLEEVAAAASVRLERMSGGRYVLAHADDAAKGNRRGGLDLRVIDAWTGRERPPASLSGGETFQASLALALGLADVVTAEAGGTRLETLFVDEGFGSLDDEGTLDDVLEMLDGLRDGGRTVGIVSHVAELRQRIPVQLRVEKGRDGSTLRPMVA